MAAVAKFNLIREATDTVFQIMRSGHSPVALEFLDASTVQVVKQIKKLLDPNGIMNPKKIFD
jgi:FAD/FMN-containing dehydrogenase